MAKAPKEKQPPIPFFSLIKCGNVWLAVRIEIEDGIVTKVHTGTPAPLYGALEEYKLDVVRHLIEPARSNPIDYGTVEVREKLRTGAPDADDCRKSEIAKLLGAA